MLFAIAPTTAGSNTEGIILSTVGCSTTPAKATAASIFTLLETFTILLSIRPLKRPGKTKTLFIRTKKKLKF